VEVCADVSLSGRRDFVHAGTNDLTAGPAPAEPTWVAELIHEPVSAGASFCHVSADFAGVRAMDILTFQQRVVEAYQTIFEQLHGRDAHCPVRFWAFVPGIHDDLGAALDRYMIFNAGRYGAYQAHLGGATSFSRSLPTGSAVGVTGDRFVLHCLAASDSGIPIDNPRQVPAYRYSRRFGPMPPCFARATLVPGPEGRPLLLVGGTASITGEDSRHRGHLEEQADETFRNLASVVASATGRRLPEDVPEEDLRALLAVFQDLRVYFPRAEDRHTIGGLVRARFPSLRRLEFHQAALCRSDLLIEIEGLALP
jgi:chorismate lyase / 3-hydroxybenzoate synthase